MEERNNAEEREEGERTQERERRREITHEREGIAGTNRKQRNRTRKQRKKTEEKATENKSLSPPFEPPQHRPEPPSTSHATAAPASRRLRRARYALSPCTFFLCFTCKFRLLHAGDVGENSSPRSVFSYGPDGFWPRNMYMGQKDSGPTRRSGSGPAQTKFILFLGRNRPSQFWADPDPMTCGAEPGPVSWAGPAPLIY